MPRERELGRGACRMVLTEACFEIPAIVREFSDEETLEVALIENIQRQDLNAIEEAHAYKRLVDDYSHTQEELGRLVHKSRSHVANLLRLLDLPASVRGIEISCEVLNGDPWPTQPPVDSRR